MLNDYSVTDVVCACQRTYDIIPFEQNNIKINNFEFPDGTCPSNLMIKIWQDLVAETCYKNGKTLAVHCISGLGRAPVLAGISLVDEGMNGMKAAEYLRAKREHALNQKQLNFLIKYKKEKSSECVII